MSAMELKRGWSHSKRSGQLMMLVGCSAVAAYNAWRWRKDRALAQGLRHNGALRRLPLSATPRVSILVAAWNESTIIGRHIGSVLALRYSDVEYVLCAGGPDGTYQMAKRYERPGVIVLEQQHGEGKQAAIRRCLEQATGNIIFLTDADCLLDDDCFERTVGPIILGKAEAVSGGFKPLEEQALRSPIVAYRSSADVYASFQAGPTGLSGSNAAMSRGALDRAGNFRENVSSGTDYHLAKALLAAGVEISRVSESRVATQYPERLSDYARQQRRWLRNVAVLGARYGAYTEVACSLRTSLLGLGMLLLPLSTPLLGKTAFRIWFLALAHGALSKVRYLAFALTLGHVPRPASFVRTTAWAVPLTLIDFYSWTQPLLDYVLQKRRVW